MALTVVTMSITDRLVQVLTRSKKNFGPDVAGAIDALVSPTNLAILGGTLVLWAGSHLFGVGEIVDVLLLAVGAFAIGWSIGDVAQDLYTFADRTLNGRPITTWTGQRRRLVTRLSWQVSRSLWRYSFAAV